MLTWLHISDLHFRASQTYNANVVLKALLRDIAERIQADGLRPDFIAVTGDVAFSGQPAEYTLAQSFFDDLLAATQLKREHLFIVPGNHDANRNLVTAGAKAIGAALTDRDSVNTLLATPDDRRLVMARFKGYVRFVNAYLGQGFDDEHYFYVRALEADGRRVAVLGLNSAWLCGSDKDKADGLVIGERQARGALEQADGAECKIALLHHPFDWLREFDQNDSAAMLTDGCDFILHGHLHRSAATQLTSPDSAAMILAGGACYETRDYPNMVNWVRVDPATGAGTVFLRRYSPERGGFWAKDTLTYRNVQDGVYSFSLRSKLSGQSRGEAQNAPIASSVSNTLSPSLPGRVQVRLVIVGDLHNFNPRAEQDLIEALATFMRVESNRFRVLDASAGSIVVHLQIPVEVAGRLQEMGQRRDVRLKNIGIVSMQFGEMTPINLIEGDASNAVVAMQAAAERIIAKYHGKRIQARPAESRVNQYFVGKRGGRYELHYLDPGAARICDEYKKYCVPLEPEEEFILFQASRAEDYRELQMEAVLREMALLDDRPTATAVAQPSVTVPEDLPHAEGGGQNVISTGNQNINVVGGVQGGITINYGGSLSTQPAAAPQSDYDLQAVRELLGAAFSDEEIVTLAFDRFRPVYEDISGEMGKTKKIRLLVDWCNEQVILDELLAQVKRRNPNQHARFASRLKR